jgi:tripartite-type tricarboxylate transporter receptor subunit TctC
MRYRAGIVLFVLIASWPPATLSLAADYPTKPITLINPNAPGGGHDAVSRAFAMVAEKMLGQPVVVLNKAGASTMLGMTAVAQAAPDGYTLGVDSTTTTNALEWEIANGRKPPLTRDDLVPIGGLTVNVPLIIVPYNSPWKTMADMVRDLKAKQGYYAFCSGGLYGGTHFPVEVLLQATGT